MNSLLTATDIRGLFTATVFQRGHSYYKQGRVKDLFYDSSRDTWYARVRGTKSYKVNVQVDEGEIDAECNCPAFDQSFNPCKHIAAVLLDILESESEVSSESSMFAFSLEKRRADEKKRQDELARQQQERQSIYIKHLTDQFIDRLANQQQVSLSQEGKINKETLMVEWICKIEKPHYRGKLALTLEMKVGQKRTYVVKKIKDFLKAVKAHEQYAFTKSFTFDLLEQEFTEVDQEIIRLLHESIKYEEIYKDFQSSSIYQSSTTSDDRKIIISPIVANEILEKLQRQALRFENKNHIFNQLEIHEHELPFTLQLEKGKSGDFQLDLSEVLFTDYLEPYGYLVQKNIIYKLSPTQQKVIKELKSLVEKTNSPLLPIGSDQIEPFLAHVAPKMNNIGKLEIAENITSQIMKFPLQSKMYIDSQQDVLQVSLEYHYGENKIGPFQQAGVNKDTSNSPILIRDAEKEQEIMAVIESCPLKFNGNFLYLEGEEEIYDFLFDTLPRIEGRAEIFLTNAVKSLILPDRVVPSTNINVDSSGNLLEISFNIDGIEQEEIENILRHAVEKKRFYRLPNGAFVSLDSEEFQTIHKVFQEFNIKPAQLQKETLQLPLYRGMQLEEIINKENGGNAKYGGDFRRLLNRLKNPEDLDFVIPDTLQAELRDYQNYGFQWLSTLKFYGLGGILADDMGLGKTVQTITFILSEIERNKDSKPTLIVAPASLVYNWKNELKKFAPTLKAEVMIGSPQERIEMLQKSTAPDIWITSYPTLRQDINSYKQLEIGTLILDEAQAVKNHATKTARALREINAKTRFALSGTPIENSIDELWSIFQTIMPDFFPAQKAFRQLSPEKVARMIRPFILRRLKKDVLKELPDKIESVHVSELTNQQKELYLAYLEKIKTEAKESLQGEGFQKSRIKILAGLTRLRQLCCHPSLFLEDYKGESGKLQQLMEIASNAVENGKRLLIFSQFTSMLSIIRDGLTEAGISLFYLDGKTAPKDRVKMVDQFNQGEANVFLISLKAGNTGLNLTGADTVILYDLWWNPAVEEQAAGRAHRMGQKNVVQVIRLITQGTIEEKIYELQQSKKELIETVMQEGDQALSKITEQDIREILNI